MPRRLIPSFGMILLIFVILAGCQTRGQNSAPAAQPTQTALQPPLAAEDTSTPQPTHTSQPTPTQNFSPTPAASATSTATPVPTVDTALSQVKLIGLDWYRNYDMLLSFQFPGPVDPSKYRVTLENEPYVKEYRCEVLKQYPDRLYCRGQGLIVEDLAWVRIYQDGSSVPGFERHQSIPYFNK